MRVFDEINLSETKVLTQLELVNIGKNIYRLRSENNLTQLDVAFYTFTNITSIWKLEKGLMRNVTINTLLKLCQLFKISLIELFEKKDFE